MDMRTATAVSLTNQAGLRDILQKLWSDHVMWTRAFIVSTASDFGDLSAVTDELLRNPTNFANVLKPLYGVEKAKAFETLLKDHLVIAAQLVNAFKNGDVAAAETEHKKWYANADAIANALPQINPNWDTATWQSLLYDHLNMTENEAAQILGGKFEESIRLYNQIEDEALKMADTMADGISKRGESANQAAMAPAPQQQKDSMFEYPKNLNDALSLIQQAVAGENEDRMFYGYLIENAPSEEDKQIIKGIQENEISHYGWFRQIYKQLTGKPVPKLPDEKFTPPASYCEGLGKALLGEQNAVSKYRRILYAMQDRVHINMLTQIITDEIRHGILYSYLYAGNGCRA